MSCVNCGEPLEESRRALVPFSARYSFEDGLKYAMVVLDQFPDKDVAMRALDMVRFCYVDRLWHEKMEVLKGDLGLGSLERLAKAPTTE